MKLKSSEIIGLDIKSALDGKSVGKVADLIVSKQKGKIQAIVVKKASVIADGEIIMWEDVEAITAAGVTVKSASVVKKGNDSPEKIAVKLNKPEYINQSEVKNTEGESLGMAEDVVIDTDTGRMVSIQTKQGKKEIEIPLDQVISVEKQETLIQEKSDPQPVANKNQESESGGIGEKIQDFVKAAGAKLKPGNPTDSIPLPAGTTVTMPSGNSFITEVPSTLEKK